MAGVGSVVTSSDNNQNPRIPRSLQSSRQWVTDVRFDVGDPEREVQNFDVETVSVAVFDNPVDRGDELRKRNRAVATGNLDADHTGAGSDSFLTLAGADDDAGHVGAMPIAVDIDQISIGSLEREVRTVKNVVTDAESIDARHTRIDESNVDPCAVDIGRTKSVEDVVGELSQAHGTRDVRTNDRHRINARATFGANAGCPNVGTLQHDERCASHCQGHNGSGDAPPFRTTLTRWCGYRVVLCLESKRHLEHCLLCCDHGRRVRHWLPGGQATKYDLPAQSPVLLWLCEGDNGGFTRRLEHFGNVSDSHFAGRVRGYPELAP